jgi:hypothetical protein
VERATATRNWFGLASVVVLFVWFIFAKGATPSTLAEQAGVWLILAVAHVLAIQATRLRPFGWIYLLPLLAVWALFLVSITGVLH